MRLRITQEMCDAFMFHCSIQLQVAEVLKYWNECVALLPTA